MSKSKLHEWALYYASRGWEVFPLKANTPLPLTKHGLQDSSKDPVQIDAWWAQWPDANIAVNLAASGMMVFDIDPQNGGDVTAAEQYPDISSTMVANTPSGGTHSFFQVPVGVEVPGRFGTGIDGKWKGYVLLYPSIRRGFKDKPDGDYVWSGEGWKGQAPVMPAVLNRPPRVQRDLVEARAGSLEDLPVIQKCLDALDDTFYEEGKWIQVAMALHHWEKHTEGAGTAGFELFDDWSSKDPQGDRYQPHSLDALWDRLKDQGENPVTLGSLKHWSGHTAEQQNKASMDKARAAFGGMNPEEKGKLWTTVSRVPFSAVLPVGEYVASLHDREWKAFINAWTKGDAEFVAVEMAKKFGGNCQRMFEEMQSRFGIGEDVREVIRLAAMAVPESEMDGYPTIEDVEVSGEIACSEEGPISRDFVEAREVTVYEIADLKNVFAGCTYISSLDRVFMPNGRYLDEKRFNNLFGGCQFVLDRGGKKLGTKAWEAFLAHNFVTAPMADVPVFAPHRPPFELRRLEGLLTVNTYIPVRTPKAEGDVTPFLNHLRLLLPDDRDRRILLSWMAALIQNPGKKFRWAPVLQGAEGNGKSLVLSVLRECVGRRYFHAAQAADLGNKFNDWITNKLLIGVDELDASGDKKAEVLRTLLPMITEEVMGVQGKGKDAATAGDVCANFFFTTNVRGAVGKGINGRRYAVFYTAQQQREGIAKSGMTGNYFNGLTAWLKGGGYAYINHYLSTYAIAEEFNPAGTCGAAPATSSYHEAVSESMGSVEQEIMNAVEEGRQGFVEPWISSRKLHELLVEAGLEKRVPYNQRKAMLENLGYQWHPALVEGRTNNPVLPDAKKTVLFVKKGHPINEMTSVPEICRRYSEANAQQFVAGNFA